MNRRSSTSLPWYRELRTPRTTAPGALPPCIHAALETSARASPERALLVDRNRYVTQRELLDLVHRRARQLLERCGGTDRIVAVRLEPGIEAVISYFACLAAGLRYLPVPRASAPVAERVLRALSPAVLVTTTSDADESVELETLFVDADETNRAGSTGIALPKPDPRRIAHVLPTSGTETGMPKAVLTDHVGSMLSHEWRFRLWGDDLKRDVIGCNIFGIWDVVPALFYGVPAVVLDDATMRDPFALAEGIVRYGITRMMLTPTLLDACLANADGVDALQRLRCIVLCGEVVTAELMARAWGTLPRVRIANLYSLSESHDVAAGDLTPDQRITSGLVADFAEVHVTDPDDRERLLPIGEPGRVLIGGEALAAGYVDPELTAQRFFDVSFGWGATTQRVYDTGDLGVLHGDGSLEIRGRIADAVKVRGAWAEPDSIGAMLRRHPDVGRAAVVADSDNRGRTRLWAFVVARDTAARGLEGSLRRWLSERVAPQSVPAKFMLVEGLPLLPSSKVDTRRLREMARRPPAAGRRALTELLETVVLSTFREVLERPDASAEDDLETLGCDSLAVIVLCGELTRRTGRRVRVADLRGHPSAHAIARHLDRRGLDGTRSGWRLPALEFEGDTRQPARRSGHGRRVLVTGPTGALGRALIARLLRETDLEVTAVVRARSAAEANDRLESSLSRRFERTRLTSVAGDLALTRFGLSTEAFRRLAVETQAILHVGADLDMFAGYEALEAVNVGGTREVLRLAFEGGARVHHLSSSAVLPVDPDRTWDETRRGAKLMRSLAPQLAASDGYSRSKLAAETLVWLAAERGLAVAVTRIPHLVGPGISTRLVNTIRALVTTRVLPDGEWSWQLAPVQAGCAHVIGTLDAERAPPPLVHLTTRELRATEVADALSGLGFDMKSLSVPVVVTELAHSRVAEPAKRIVSGLNQLIREYGPRAALSLADARLAAREMLDDDPLALLAELSEDLAG